MTTAPCPSTRSDAGSRPAGRPRKISDVSSAGGVRINRHPVDSRGNNQRRSHSRACDQEGVRKGQKCERRDRGSGGTLMGGVQSAETGATATPNCAK
jgi:hypothetical protein